MSFASGRKAKVDAYMQLLSTETEPDPSPTPELRWLADLGESKKFPEEPACRVLAPLGRCQLDVIKSNNAHANNVPPWP